MDGDFARLDIVEFIGEFINEYGYSPSFREIAAGCGFASTSGVAHHMSVLRNMGRIVYQDHVARSVRLP
jgi:SOS-response transcriptional repressor LexA